MSDEQPKAPSDADRELERAIRAERKFSLAEAIGRMAGPGAMKGESPIPARQQAEAEIDDYIRKHLADAAGVLPGVLSRCVRESEFLLDHFGRPLEALSAYLLRILESEYRLKELVREVDAEWGRVFGARPFFEQEGRPPHADDPYTVESVRTSLQMLLKALPAAGESLRR